MPSESIAGMGEFLRRHWFYLLIQAVSVGFWIWWLPYAHVPLPGYAVAAIAVLAAVMSVHPDIRPWQKFVWLLLIGAFLVTEFRAIRKDRDIAERQALNDRAAQNLAFQVIRDAENTHFDVTVQGLQDAIQGNRTTLEIANATLLQTRPHALFGPPRFELDTQKISSDSVGKSFSYNVYIENIGNDPARNVRFFSAMYLGKPDDSATQANLYMRFEKDFSARRMDKVAPEMAVRSSLFNSFRSPLLTADDVKQLEEAKLTLYEINRIEYSDATGHWLSDRCAGLIVPLQSAGIVTLSCAAKYNNPRYSIKQQ